MTAIALENTAPIGVFDSGIGGLTILREIVRQLPEEQVIYYADRKHCPYGQRTTQQIIALAESVTQQLLEMGVKMIVIACNTATMAAVGYLREKYDIPFVAIEPAVKPATANSRTGIVGVIATKSSVESSKLKELCDRFSYGKIVVTQAGVGLVDLIERNQEDSPQTMELLHKYIDPMIEKGIDHLVLGCTHYPFVQPQIEQVIAGRDITIINPAPSIARQAERVLREKSLLNPGPGPGSVRFFSSNGPEDTAFIAEKFNAYKG